MDNETMNKIKEYLADTNENGNCDNGWSEGFIIGLDYAGLLGDGDIETLHEWIKTTSNKSVISSNKVISIDPSTIANVIGCIQAMKNNEYSKFITGTWVLSYIDELHECGLMSSDEYGMLIDIYK